MNKAPSLHTQRLLLRPWKMSDRAPFAALNADPRVTECLPGQLSRAESDALVDRIQAHFKDHGFGLWAVEVSQVAPLIGFIGLSIPSFDAPFTPCVEIGWRLAADHWGQGYATEGARAALVFGFETLQLDEIVSFTVPHNYRSRRVMEKIGLVRDPNEDFGHPLLPADHPLQAHVLYRLKHSDWKASTQWRKFRHHFTLIPQPLVC